MKIGARIRIIHMVGEPQYDGKEGEIFHIDPPCKAQGWGEQWHGTWGGLAVQPERDEYKVIGKAE